MKEMERVRRKNKDRLADGNKPGREYDAPEFAEDAASAFYRNLKH